jgi:hypothetical protein
MVGLHEGFDDKGSVTEATQAPVSRPNKEEQSRNIQYSEHLEKSLLVSFS